MSRGGIAEFTFFFLYLAAQVIFFKNLVLFNVGFCFPYIAFILFMSVETSTFLLIAIGFALGFTVDIFYNSLGLHASATVFVAFIRNFWLGKIAPQKGYNKGARPILLSNNLGWLLLYIYPLIFLHHTIIFFVEIGGFALIGYTFLKIMASSLLTLSTLLLLQYMLPGKKRI